LKFCRVSASGFHLYIKTGIYFITYQNIKTELKTSVCSGETALQNYIGHQFVMTSSGSHCSHCFLA